MELCQRPLQILICNKAAFREATYLFHFVVLIIKERGREPVGGGGETNLSETIRPRAMIFGM